MTSTPVATARPGKAAPTPPRAVPVHSHSRCLAVFDAFMGALRGGGWTARRLDTYVHPNRPGWQVKHQFASGIWEIHLDRETEDASTGERRTTAQISRYRDRLPDVDSLYVQLFGDLAAKTEG